jgi:hypothetical protein
MTLPTSPQLPLAELFRVLRANDFPLGVDDYLALVRALQGGFGLSDADDLLKLCCTLWAKSPGEAKHLAHLFDQTLRPFFTHLPLSRDGGPTPTMPGAQETPSSAASPAATPSNNPPTPKPQRRTTQKPAPVVLEQDPVTRIATVRRSDVARATNSGRFRLLSDYFPVTTRQMKQSWRVMRQRVREGPPIELDVEATVDNIGRRGLLLAPVLLPRRVNRAEIILLVDRDGSMVPFHGLMQQLTETAQRGGKLRQAATFYFHDWPDTFVFHEPARITAENVLDLMRGQVRGVSISPRTAVLLMSDAGAARGTYDEARIAGTRYFVDEILKPNVRRFAWLNPMPKTRWRGTSAESISRMLPMFEMNQEGLLAAIGTLRGRSTAGGV